LYNAQAQLDPLTWYDVGQLAVLVGDRTLALHAYARVIANGQNVGFERAVLAMGNIYETLGDVAMAMGSWIKVPKLSAGAMYYLGNHFRQARMLDEAIRRYQMAINLGSGTTYEFLGSQSIVELYLYDLRSPGKSVVYFQRAAYLRPENMSTRLLLVRAFIDAREFDHAIDEATSLLKCCPTSAPFAYELLGLAYYRSRNLVKAEEAYKRSLDLGNQGVWVYYALGLISADLGKEMEAHLYLQKALEVEPSFEWARRALEQTEVGK